MPVVAGTAHNYRHNRIHCTLSGLVHEPVM